MARGAFLRLLLDEMYPPRFAQTLVEHGHDAIAVASRPDLLGRTDAALLAIATEERRAPVTENARDLAALAAILAERGQAHAGIVLVHPRRFPRTADGVAGFGVAFDQLAATWAGGTASTIVWLGPAMYAHSVDL